jgi:hypothetical protein
MADTINSLMKPGILFDTDIMKAESKRIEKNLRNNGYYSFAEDYILYDADTFKLKRKADIFINLKPNTELEKNNNSIVKVPYPTYRIRSVTVNAKNSTETGICKWIPSTATG